jgi:hypothetical protein
MLKLIKQNVILFVISYYLMVGTTYLMVNYCNTRTPFWGNYIIIYYLLNIIYFILSLIMIKHTYKSIKILFPLSIILFELFFYGINIIRIANGY